MTRRDDLPRIVQLIGEGAPLDGVQAAAWKLASGGKEIDADRTIATAIEAYWRARPGRDPYWDFLGDRGYCQSWGETNKYENLAIGYFFD